MHLKLRTPARQTYCRAATLLSRSGTPPSFESRLVRYPNVTDRGQFDGLSSVLEPRCVSSTALIHILHN